jgi:streptogramin lyase
MNARTHTVRFFRLPAIHGNQPMFLTFDTRGHLWFTTPDNSMIGEFDPQGWKLEGQWRVIPDSGPWDLAFVQGQVWYTENFISGIGVFNPVTHAFHDYVTPSPNSHPYGLSTDPTSNGHLWFTENSNSAERIGLLDTATGKITEYPIRATLKEGLTPHLITVDAQGHPWWSEGTARAIGTLDPAAAVPGQCVTTSGDCSGVIEYLLPPTPPGCVHSHVSGITAWGRMIWFDDSLSAQVGSFDPQNLSFRLYNLAVCNTHPHDGLLVDASGHVWWNEQYLNLIGELS